MPTFCAGVLTHIHTHMHKHMLKFVTFGCRYIPIFLSSESILQIGDITSQYVYRPLVVSSLSAHFIAWIIVVLWNWCNSSQRERECKLVNASFRRPASWYSLQGNHFPLLAWALWLIVHKSFQFSQWASVSIVLSGRCHSVEACQQPNPQTWRHSNQSVIKLLITDS